MIKMKRLISNTVALNNTEYPTLFSMLIPKTKQLDSTYSFDSLSP